MNDHGNIKMLGGMVQPTKPGGSMKYMDITFTPNEHLKVIHAISCQFRPGTPGNLVEVFEKALAAITQPHHDFKWRLDWRTLNGIAMAISDMQAGAMIDNHHGEALEYIRLHEKLYRNEYVEV
jgi:hypothetical protein